MLKKIILVTMCIVLVLSLVGCGGNSAADDENNLTVEVVNNTEEIIISWAAFFGPDLDEWGEDLLGDQVIAPGDTIKFVLPQGEYSLVLFTYELYVVKSVSNITEDTVIEVGGGDKIPVLVENNSDKDIAVFFISPSVNDDWGEDLIGGLDVIPAEFGRRFLFIDPVPDIPVNTGNGNKEEMQTNNEDEEETEESELKTEEREIPEGPYYDIYYIYADGEEIVQFDVLIDGKRTLTISE
jgi:hypothetical protein